MIQIKKAEKDRPCNVCYKKDKVYNITFWFEGTHSGTQITLCDKCMKNLKDCICSILEESKQKKGEWIQDKEKYHTICCSVCGHEAYWDTDYGQQEFDFCPYCGTDMRDV